MREAHTKAKESQLSPERWTEGNSRWTLTINLKRSRDGTSSGSKAIEVDQTRAVPTLNHRKLRSKSQAIASAWEKKT